MWNKDRANKVRSGRRHPLLNCGGGGSIVYIHPTALSVSCLLIKRVWPGGKTVLTTTLAYVIHYACHRYPVVSACSGLGITFASRRHSFSSMLEIPDEYVCHSAKICEFFQVLTVNQLHVAILRMQKT